MTHLSRRFWTVPVIGLFYGLVAGTLFYALGHVFNGLIVAAIILLAVHGLNRFLHFDGLIDLGDGLIATGTMEKKMSAMKDTRVGAGGVAFASLFILLIASSLASVPEWLYIVPIAMEVLAKNSLFTVAAFGRPREGLGNPFVSNAAPSTVILSSALSMLLLSPFLALTALTHGRIEVTAATIFVMVAVSVLLGVAMSRLAMRSFGCVNGDLMGATNEISKAAVLLTALAVLSWSM